LTTAPITILLILDHCMCGLGVSYNCIDTIL
jgi:hypothetical protein